MLLAVDVGNTNILFALVADGAIAARWRTVTEERRTADEYAVWLHQLLSLGDRRFADVDAVIISSVVPRVLPHLEELSRTHLKVEPLVAGRGAAAFAMPIDLPDPSAVGADRVVNAMAAHARSPGDTIVVDFGTATTFDVVDYRGAYKGGVIAPGINLSLEALVSAAAKLPRIVVAAPDPGEPVIGTTTETAMRSGIFWGYVAMVEGMLARLKEEIGRPCRVVATGGLAPMLSAHLPAFDELVPDLTIDGLALLHRQATTGSNAPA